MDTLNLTGGAGASPLEWAWAGRAIDDESRDESGDAHLVALFPSGALVAVIDGLGHGPEAALAARAAVQILEQDAAAPPQTLVERCHEGLRRTRGAVMSLASFNRARSSMTWVGVGNVDAILLRARHDGGRPRDVVTPRGGVLGYQLPPLRPVTLDVNRGDLLVMATDGIRRDFTSRLSLMGHPQAMADRIMAEHHRGIDDALVVVARYLGDGRG